MNTNESKAKAVAAAKAAATKRSGKAAKVAAQNTTVEQDTVVEYDLDVMEVVTTPVASATESNTVTTHFINDTKETTMTTTETKKTTTTVTSGVNAGLQAWRDAQKAARADKLARIAKLQSEHDALKKLGAKLTDAGRERLVELKQELAAAKGVVSGKAKAVKLIEDAIALLTTAADDADKHNVVSDSVVPAFHPAIDQLRVLLSDTHNSVWTRKPVGFAATKVASPKFDVVAGINVKLADKAKAKYDGLFADTSDVFSVVKVVGKKAIVLDTDGVRGVADITHLIAA